MTEDGWSKAIIRWYVQATYYLLLTTYYLLLTTYYYTYYYD